MVTEMPPDTEQRLARQPFSYAEQGGTDLPEPPPGYRTFSVRQVIGSTEQDFVRAARRILTWQMHERAGLAVEASAPEAEPGVHVVVTIGVGPLRTSAPCRVIRAVREPDRAGFTYGTLPGHPERGEEAFYVERGADGTVTGTVTAFSAPDRWFTKLAGPVARLAQRYAARRYLDALR